MKFSGMLTDAILITRIDGCNDGVIWIKKHALYIFLYIYICDIAVVLSVRCLSSVFDLEDNVIHFCM